MMSKQYQVMLYRCTQRTRWDGQSISNLDRIDLVVEAGDLQEAVMKARKLHPGFTDREVSRVNSGDINECFESAQVLAHCEQCGISILDRDAHHKAPNKELVCSERCLSAFDTDVSEGLLNGWAVPVQDAVNLGQPGNH